MRIAATLSAASATYGSRVTLSGRLLYRPDASRAYAPFPAQPVAVYSSRTPASPVATLTTGQSGQFRLPLPAEAATTTWTLIAGGAVGTPAASTATAKLTEMVRVPVAFSKFSVSLDQYGKVGYSGCLGLRAGIPVAAVAGFSQPKIQYSAGPAGPWHSLASATLTRAPCGNGGEEFSGRVTARLNLAYYRAYFPRHIAALGTSYLAAASPAVLAWKFADRITSFRASPVTVGERGNLTVEGALQYYHFGWHGYRGQDVLIILRPKGAGTWYWIRRVSTGPDGRFDVTFADPLSATWSAEYPGNGTHLATVAAKSWVLVK